MSDAGMLYLVLPFVLCLSVGAPVAISLGIGVIAFLTLTDAMPSSVLSMQMYSAAASFPLMAVPFFIFAGDLMNESGITIRLINFSKLLMQRIRGGLAYSLVLTGTLFAGLTGSAVADTAATIKIMAPAMEKEGYHRDFTAALAASTGILGPIIPPSTLMIVYGATVGASVGGLFIGGILPGLLISFGLMLVVGIIARKRGYNKSDAPFSFLSLAAGLKDASLALIMPVIILVGIRGGVFTPTEGGAVAVAYSLFIGIFVYRTLTLKKFLQSAILSGITASVILLIVAASQPFGWLIAIGRLPALIANHLLASIGNPYIILILINLFLLLMGMFLEAIAIVLLLGPILAPVAAGLGIDPVHFGVMVCVNICIGMITPPVGVNLFVAAPVAGVPISALSRAVMPFMGVILIALLLITFYPPLVLWLPSVLR